VVIFSWAKVRLNVPINAARRQSKGTMIVYAFPGAHSAERLAGEARKAESQGMTLNDWFAGQIMAGLLGSDPSNSTQRDKNGQLCPMDEPKLVNMAKTAYQAANALMRVRAADKNELQ
jgi:hypothetical protein